MKRLVVQVALLVALLTPASVHAAIVKQACSSGGATGAVGYNSSPDIDITTSPAITLITVHTVVFGSGSTISDNAGNTFTGLTAQTSTDTTSKIFYVLNPATSATYHVIEGLGSFGSLEMCAWSGVAAYEAENGTIFASGTSTQTGGGITPGGNDRMFWTGISFRDDQGTPAINSGFASPINVANVGGNHLGSAASSKIQTTGGVEDPTWSWTNSTRGGVVIATFTSSGGGGGCATPPTLALLGVGGCGG